MKLALISDIHANLPALESVLADIDEREPDQIYCLGDLVGYNTWPTEVVQMIQARRIPTIAGNYDEGVGLNSDDCGCAYKTPEDEARGVESITYTNGVIEESARAYLRSLPRHLRLSFRAGRQADARTFELLMVHGSPRRINEYLFEDRPDASFLRLLKSEDCDLMCFGHTHKPFYRALEDPDSRWGLRHIVNTGSVGKPKDGDARAGYVLLDIDPERKQPLMVDFIRVEYDIEKAAQSVEKSPLPNEFAEALRLAR